MFIEGSCLDQTFVRVDKKKRNRYSMKVVGKYHSDHKAMSLTIKE